MEDAPAGPSPQPLDEPPYVAYVTTTGITFTFGGLKINERNEVQDLTDRSIPGLYGAGELVGGLFYENYPGGSGLMSGSVFCTSGPTVNWVGRRSTYSMSS